MPRTRVWSAVFALALVLMAGRALTVHASDARVTAAAAVPPPRQPPSAAPSAAQTPAQSATPVEPKPSGEQAAKPDVATQPEANESDSWAPTFIKLFNFLILFGVLAYLLRTPIAGYLQSRSEQIRKDLIAAAALRKEGEARLATVRTQLSALPAELAQLKKMGEDELAAEHVRMKDATARERQQMIDRTHREIDVQFRVARRNLLDHVAQLSMDLARARVVRDITPADQDRLVDQYAGEVR